MRQVQAIIQYKTKVKEFVGGEKYINYKVDVGRSDCNLRPCDHDYYNSDMFPSMLKRATLKAQGGRSWSRLSDLPECITVDTSKFMAVVTIRVEI